MEAGEIERDRAQLWAIYWGIRALDRPPPTLRLARRELWSILDRPEPPPRPPLRLVRGGRRVRLEP